MTALEKSTTEHASAASPESLQIRREQVQLLYQPSLHAAIATAFAAGFLAYIQSGVIADTVILIWLLATSAIIAARIAIYFIYQQQGPDPVMFWQRLYTVVTVFAGLSWGTAGIFLFPAADFERQAATIVILAGMAAGAGTTLSALRSTVFTFLLLTMLPMTVHLFWIASDTMFLIAIMCAVYTLFLAYSAHHSYNTQLQNITLRIRSSEREKAVRMSEQTLLKTSDILKMIAQGEPATNVYDAIALLYESRHPGMRCSILELKGNQLIHGGAPSLPDAYCEAMNGLENGPDIASCGTATYTGERVLVEDIETDPKWQQLKAIAMTYGLRCCWSEPIKDKTGKVLGAFGMYYNHPALPDAYELADLEAASRLAGIVMERQQREALLVKLHSAFEYAYDAIIIADLDARLEYVNPAFERMTGYSAAECVGEYIKILRSDKHPDAFYKRLLTASQQGKSWQGEITIKCKDGSFRDVERSVSPVFDKQGNVLFQVAIQRDITEHKVLEEKFQQAQKMEAIGTLVGGIAHDFNNILAGINGNLYLAQRRVQHDPDACQKMDNIEQLSNRAADLIQQLLTFARKDRVNMQALQLQPLVQEAFKFLRSSIPESIDMQLDMAPDTLQITGDSTQIYQVLLNLVNNSRDALNMIHNPHIIIQVERFWADSHCITQHQYVQSGHYAHISIADNGSGIPEHQLKHIFEPFFTTKEVGKGTGLGLSMVFGAVKRHHGFIEVSSTPDNGSRFDIYIPLLENTESITQQPQAKHDSNTQRGQNELILLVDDDAQVLEMGQEVLVALGYRVITASNGVEAVDLFIARKHEISLVITDIVMPKLGGVEAMRKINNIHPDMKIIFSTGYDMDAVLHEVTAHNQYTIIYKPFKIDELSKTIRDTLNA